MSEPALKIDYSEPERLAWRPREALTISAWSEKNRILSSTSEERGPFRLRRVPYMAPIMDAALDTNIETIVLMKSAQIAFTTCLENLVGFYATTEVCPVMFILADEDTAQYINVERLQKMFRESPALSEYFIPRGATKEDITLANGSYIVMAWASSVARLGSRPVKFLFLDEVDKPGYYLTTKEASAISLAIDRTETYYNRKIFIGSTPTVDTGNITKEIESCDVVYDWHVPCPHCGIKQPLRWSVEYAHGFSDGLYRAEDGEMRPLGGVVWEGGRQATKKQIAAAGYKCGTCEKLWTTIEKNKGVEMGEMVPRANIDYKPKKVGYHINRLYSLLGRSGELAKLVADWIDCVLSSDPKKLQGFVNSTLAEPWTQTVLKKSEAEVLEARTDLKPQTVPPLAVAITCGVDMQQAGFYFITRAWAADFTSWLIHYGFLGSWDDLAEYLFNSKYPVVGKQDIYMSIWRAALDTGGGRALSDYDPTMTTQAYDWLRQNSLRGPRVWGTKGSTRPLASRIHIGKLLDKYPNGKAMPGGLQLIHINTEMGKDTYHYRLQQARDGGPQAGYLHRDVGEDYAMQILAEEKRLNDKGVQEWQLVKPDNHYLDAEVLCQICADPEWPGGGVNLIAKALEKQSAQKQAAVTRKKVKTEKRGYTRPGWLER